MSNEYNYCAHCGGVTLADEFCDQCVFDMGERVDANISDQSPAVANTRWVSGTVMVKYRPGDDLALDVDGIHVVYPAREVVDVQEYAARTEGWR